MSFCKAVTVCVITSAALAGCAIDSPMVSEVDDSPVLDVPLVVSSLRRGPPKDTTTVAPLGALEGCDEASVEVCEEEEPGGAGALGYSFSFRWVDCTGSVGLQSDFDNDGFSDTCEATLAAAFQPMLKVSTVETLSGREPYWAVQPSAAPGAYSVRIFYALAYYDDEGHKGDSEFIWIDVESVATSSLWALQQIFLSAHWGEGFPADRSALIARGSYDEYVDVYGGRPVVWVSQGKHANYRSRGECNKYPFIDGCSNSISSTLPALPSANLGSRNTKLINCVGTRTGNFSAHPGNECFWDFASFKGWNIDPSGDVTSYGLLLGAYGF